MTRLARLTSLLLLALLPLLVLGCKSKQAPDYSRALPPGGQALRKITDPKELPDLKQAFARRDQGLVQAIDRSIQWYGLKSTESFYPINTITHDQARLSAQAFRDILTHSSSAADFEKRLLADFDVWTSVGWDGSGTVFFTGYYTPIFTASPVKTEQYRFPLYQKPVDLVVDEASGKVVGRKVHGVMKEYPSRAQIDYYPDRLGLVGREVAWMDSKLDNYVVQVQGSAKLQMTDGSVQYLGYAASNGREYSSVGRALVADKQLDPNHTGLPAIREYFRKNPDQLGGYLARNERYIFFKAYDPKQWPAGSLGFQVTPLRSLATDKAIYPRAAVTLVQTDMPTVSGSAKFEQFMTDQDAGGAIRAPGRADIYIGIGDRAEQIAGRQAQEGRLYYFFLKPERMSSLFSPSAPASSSAGQAR